MAGLHVGNLRVGKELLDGGDGFIADTSTLRASDEQRRALVGDLAGLLVREICHLVERGANDRQRHAELHRLVFFRADQVGQEELTNAQRLENVIL